MKKLIKRTSKKKNLDNPSEVVKAQYGYKLPIYTNPAHKNYPQPTPVGSVRKDNTPKIYRAADNFYRDNISRTPIEGLLKTVVPSAAIATGVAAPAAATVSAIPKAMGIGAIQGLGFGQLGFGSGNAVDDVLYGASGEFIGPIAGALIGKGWNKVKGIFRKSNVPQATPINPNPQTHLQGEDAVKMFKDYGGEPFSNESGLGQRINRYVPEIRERYGLVNNENISDEEIANSIYKHMKQMQSQTNSANVNSMGEPRILFRGDTQRYTSLKERPSPESLEKMSGTMDNSLGNLFLGDYGRPVAGGGPERYLVGKDANVFSEGGWNARSSATGASYIEGGHDFPHRRVWFNPELINSKGGLRTRYGFLKAPAEATTSGINDMNAYFINTKNVRDATKEISVANDDFLAQQSSWKGDNIESGQMPDRTQMAKHYNYVLSDAANKDQGLLRSVRRNQLRDEHYGADYFALPNFNIRGAKHILPYDLRIPRDWSNTNIYKSIIGGAALYNFIPQDNKFKSGGVIKRIKNGVKFIGKNYIK